jgi:hypothetical protein
VETISIPHKPEDPVRKIKLILLNLSTKTILGGKKKN